MRVAALWQPRAPPPASSSARPLAAAGARCLLAQRHAAGAAPSLRLLLRPPLPPLAPQPGSGAGGRHRWLPRTLEVVAGGGPRPWVGRRCKECDRRYRLKLSEKVCPRNCMAWFEFNDMSLPERCPQCREFRKLVRERGEEVMEYKDRVATFTQFRQLRNKYLRLEKERVRHLRRQNPEELIRLTRPKKVGKNKYKSDDEMRALLLDKLARKRAAREAQLAEFGEIIYELPPHFTSHLTKPVQVGPPTEVVRVFERVAEKWQAEGTLAELQRRRDVGRTLQTGGTAPIIATPFTPRRQLQLARLRGAPVYVDDSEYEDADADEEEEEGEARAAWDGDLGDHPDKDLWR